MAAPGDLAGSLTGAFLLLRSENKESGQAPRASASADCVQQAAAGDVRAFEQLYQLHLPRVHSLVRRMTGGRDTDEITQDIFVRVWQKLGTFRGDSAFGTWLHRLAVNVIIERFRSDATRRQRIALSGRARTWRNRGDGHFSRTTPHPAIVSWRARSGQDNHCVAA